MILAFVAALAGVGSAVSADGIRLREVSDAWGIDFVHHHGGSGERYMVETMVGGLVVLDYDGDGDEDLYFVDGDALPGYQGPPPRSRLFRNDGGSFVDVTDRAGVGAPGYGCGASAADVDADGDLDLYVTAFGPNRLYRNRGDGTFEEVAAASGVGDPRWSAAAAFADTDLDGDLDLYLSNYVDFTLETHKFCGDEEAGLQGYCHPGAYQGVPDAFYRNRGDGTFEEATEAVGLALEGEAGLGVVIGDLDRDGWPDIYVANDADPNFLFRNRSDGTFEDWSLLSGTSYSEGGSPEAGMGVNLGDVDGDQRMEIVVTNFELETNALYGNTGSGLFVDRRFPSGVAEPSLLDLAFGVAFADLDQDRDLDLVVANGHILDNAKAFNENSRYRQTNSVLANDGSGRFARVPEAGMTLERASRGLGVGDLDGDGDLDIAVNNSADAAEVYQNVAGSDDGGWLSVDLLSGGLNRRGIGAWLELRSGETVQVREVRTSESYLSQSALTAHFGLGAEERVRRLRVEWPGGDRVELRDLPANRRILLTRDGGGR